MKEKKQGSGLESSLTAVVDNRKCNTVVSPRRKALEWCFEKGRPDSRDWSSANRPTGTYTNRTPKKMMMNERTTILTCLTVFLVMFMTQIQTAGAQDVTSFSRTTSPLTSDQARQLQTFIESKTADLASENPQTVVDARKNLIAPLLRAGTSNVFREAFGKAFISSAESMLTDSDTVSTFNLANAFQVLAFIRTGETNEMLARQLEEIKGSDSQADARRNSAASMLAISLKTTPPDLIRPRQYNSIMRSILASVNDAGRWSVLQREFEAMGAITSNRNIPDDIRKKALENEALILERTLSRMAASESGDLSRAVAPMILALRSQFIGLTGAMRQTFQGTISPALELVVRSAETNWETIQGNMASRSSYTIALQQSMVLHRLTSGVTDPNMDKTVSAWESGDRLEFRKSAADWLK